MQIDAGLRKHTGKLVVGKAQHLEGGEVAELCGNRACRPSKRGREKTPLMLDENRMKNTRTKSNQTHDTIW